MARRALGLTIGAAALAAVVGLGLGFATNPALASGGGRPAAAALAADMSADPTAATSTRTGEGRLVRRLQRACDRIPTLLKRSENLHQRLAGDAGTRGSLARLQARIAAAQKAGKTDRVELLQARLKVRQDVQALLPARIEQLKKAQSGLCVDVRAAVASDG